MLHEREHLERLAQPHVVGQDPAQGVLVQEGEPPEALQLVGAEPGRQADRVWLRDLGEVAQGGGPLHPGRRLGIDDPQLGQLGPHTEVGGADAHPSGLAVTKLGGEGDDLVEAGELGSVEGDVEATGHDEELVSTGQCGQHVGQRDRFAVDADLHLEVEPVGVVGLLVRERERDLRGSCGLPEVGPLLFDDLEVGQAAQVGQVVECQRQRVAVPDGDRRRQGSGDRREDLAFERGIPDAAKWVRR